MGNNGNQSMSDLQQLLRQLEGTRFYGSVEFKYEAGRVVLIRKSETFKPCEPSCGNNRSVHDDSKRHP
jgi:hypothetical protein